MKIKIPESVREAIRVVKCLERGAWSTFLKNGVYTEMRTYWELGGGFTEIEITPIRRSHISRATKKANASCKIAQSVSFFYENLKIVTIDLIGMRIYLPDRHTERWAVAKVSYFQDAEYSIPCFFSPAEEAPAHGRDWVEFECDTHGIDQLFEDEDEKAA